MNSSNLVEPPPGYAFPEHSCCQSHYTLDEKQARLVGELLHAASLFADAEQALLDALPQDAWVQFFGNWNILRIYDFKST